MSDCRVPMPVYEPPEREDNVLRGRIVFTDGTDLPLSYYRMGREVERFEMDGVRFVDEAEAAKLRALVRDMFLTWKRLDLEGEGPNRFHNGWKTFMERMSELGIEVE